MAYTVNTSAAALNRAFNKANATPTAFAATAAELTAGTIAAANKFDDGTLSDLALSTKVLTNMGILPSTVTAVKALEAALADYFAGPGKGNRGYVVLQLAEILSGFAATDVFYGAAATAWNAEVAASVADAVPQTTAFTTSAADNLTGSSTDDIFSAISSALSASKTLNASDKLAGGAGNDTLNVEIQTNWAGFTTGSITGVENLSLTNSSSNDRTFDATGITGVTALKVDAAGGNISVSNLPTGLKTVSYSNLNTDLAAASVTVEQIAGAAELASTAATDALTVNLTDVGSVETVTLNFNEFETLNIVSSGTMNIVTVGLDDAKTINVSGSAKTTITDVSSATTKVDASAATGTVAVTLTSASAVTSVKTGSAADTITADVADLVANATIDGGAGGDKLTINVAGTGSAYEYKMTGVETLALGNITSATTLSGGATTGLEKVTIKGGTSSHTNAAVTLVNMGTGALTFEASASTDDDGDVSSDHTGATTINYVASAAVIAAATSASAPAGEITVDSSAGALTVNVGAYINTDTANISAAKATSVTLNVSSGKNAVGEELSSWDSTITAAVAKTIIVDAAGDLGGTIDAVKATSLTITNGANDASLIFDSATATALTDLTLTTAEAFTFSTSDFGKVQNVTIAANKGTTTVPALPDAASLTLSGTGSASKVDLVSLGDTTHDYSVTLTATGLKGGLDVDSGVQVSAGYDVTLKVAGIGGSAGAVLFGDINSNGTRGDDVTINAAGVAGAFTVGAIYATGDVSVDATNVVGTATVGDVYGDKITVSVRGSGSSSVIGQNYNAISSATLSTGELAASRAYTVTGKTSYSTNLAVSLTGGLNVETLNVVGSNVQETVTVTGNLGAGDDILSVNTTASSEDVTVNVAGLTSYKSSTITTAGGDDTITGGAGADTIYAGAGADTMTGGAGVDVFSFEDTDSSYLTFDTITDLASTDRVVYGNADVALAAAVTSGTTARINSVGVVSFAELSATAYDTFAEKCELIDDVVATAGHVAFFAHDGSTYMFIETTTAAGAGTGTDDIVVKLTGVILPTSATTISTGTSGSATATGIYGFGA